MPTPTRRCSGHPRPRRIDRHQIRLWRGPLRRVHRASRRYGGTRCISTLRVAEVTDKSDDHSSTSERPRRDGGRFAFGRMTAGALAAKVAKAKRALVPCMRGKPMLKRNWLLPVVALLVAMWLALPATAYPTKPVTLLIAFPPGGPSDVLSRVVGAQARADPRPAVRDGQPSRRRRQHRRRGRRQRARRRPHHPDGQQQHPRHQCRALQEGQFRPRARFRADQPDRLAGQHPGGQSERAGEVAGRADRAHPRQSRQVQLRLVRPRHGRAPCRRAVQGRDQAQHHPRSLQGRRARAAGRDRGPRADDLRHRGVGGAAYQGRQGAGAGGDADQAYGGIPRACDHGRAWAEGL